MQIRFLDFMRTPVNFSLADLILPDDYLRSLKSQLYFSFVKCFKK